MLPWFFSIKVRAIGKDGVGWADMVDFPEVKRYWSLCKGGLLFIQEHNMPLNKQLADVLNWLNAMGSQH